MKGTLFFVVFFLIFTSAMFLIPTPMFPGDTLLALTDIVSSEYTAYLGALINGVIYGLIAWAIFMFAMKKIGSTASKNSVKEHNMKNKHTH